jgi:hypothetical protein
VITKSNRRISLAMKRIEGQILQRIEDLREDAGDVALRALATENQEAAADRERARLFAARADGCFEALEIVYDVMGRTQ